MTGVQTCALPILTGRSSRKMMSSTVSPIPIILRIVCCFFEWLLFCKGHKFSVKNKVKECFCYLKKMFSLVADAALGEEGGEVLGSYRSYGKLEEVKGQMIR